MAEIVYTENFIEGMLSVQLESKREEIFAAVELLASNPEIGSRIIRPVIEKQFGKDIHKLVVHPFDVFYRYVPGKDIVIVEGLLHQRRVK